VIEQHGMIEQVRRFNRTVTQRVGALDDAFLNRGRPLGQARLLWEIGPDGCDLRDLRARLDLDSGYLSRMLRALTAGGLVAVEPSPADQRVRAARLTPAGLAERAELDRRAQDAAASLLRPLSRGQRDRLVAAMAEVERLLVASAVRVEVRRPADPGARYCVLSYFRELDQRFNGGFDPALSISADDRELTWPSGLFLLATLHSEPVGSGALKLHPDGTAEIKRMWVAPAARGLGLGRRLLGDLEARAAAAGASRVRLETNGTLAEAVSLYRSAGYREVAAFSDEPYAHHWFEKPLPPPRPGECHE
jgi:DNA-binding MarR family transcriptional regulator/GNAT superfamily N-acetyltransferase